MAQEEQQHLGTEMGEALDKAFKLLMTVDPAAGALVEAMEALADLEPQSAGEFHHSEKMIDRLNVRLAGLGR